MRRTGSRNSVEDKKILCIVVREEDLPCFVVVLGKVRKVFSYCVASREGRGVSIEKCDTKFKQKSTQLLDGICSSYEQSVPPALLTNKVA